MEIEDLTKLKNLKEMVDYAAENFGDATFLEYKENGAVSKKTYAEFKLSSESFSNMLVKSGIAKPHVAIVGPTSYEWIVSFFGAANCGGAAVPLAPNETDEMNEKLIDFADVDVFVFDKKHSDLAKRVKENVPGVKLFISSDNSGEYDFVRNFDDILREYEGSFDCDIDPDEVAAIVFTSGTTGFPKGVMSTHKNFIYSATSVHVACPTKRMFCCLPIHHSFCFTGNITKSFVRGKTVCVNDNLANIVQDLQLYKPDSILAVPQIVKKLMFGAMQYASAHPEIPREKAINGFLGGNLIDLISGGAPLEAELNSKFNDEGVLVLNGYGMTECCPVIANNAVGSFRHGSVGKPIPCMNVKIENGEILVKGPNVMKGYYKNPEATKEAFSEDGYLHTGDLGHFDEDGYLYITGRCKNLILLDNGENVSAEMLEAKFASEALISEVICYNEGTAVCAEVFLNKALMAEKGISDGDKAMLEILERVNSKLASYQRISVYVIRDIPFERTASQKIKRTARSKKSENRKIVSPETPTEIRVCEAVKSQLMLKEISVTDNFFALGGDSLGAIELAVSLNIPAQLIYDKPFLRKLALAIDEESASKREKKEDVNALIKTTEGKGKKREGYKAALLTGATGFLGVHILKELLEKDIDVYCLVRSEERLKNQIEYYFGELRSSRIHTVIGDIEKEKLGLGDRAYSDLTKKIDIVFHTAANVHHAGDYSDLERTNVIGTINIISFAKESGAALQHTSTVSVHGAATVKQRYGKAVLDEHILNIGQKYEDNVYIHSKYCAEEAVLSARLEGVDSNIYRIGNLTWRSADGKFQKNSSDNGFLRRVHAMLKLGLINENMDKYPTDLTAVDECAKAYVSLALTGKVGEIYHMYNPNFLMTADMFKYLKVPCRIVSTQETIETVFANSADRDVHVYMFYLIISGRSRNVEMKSTDTVKALEETGFLWSVPDERYLNLGDHCLNFEPYEVAPMRKNGGALNPIQKLTLGVMRDAKLQDSKVYQGDGALAELYSHIKGAEIKAPLIITFDMALVSEKIKAFMEKFEKPVIFTEILGEPTLEDTDKCLSIYFKNSCDGVIAIGGGSVLDTAKIVSLRAANKDDDIDDICKIDSDCEKGVPFFAVPTTSGTGSEVTIFAVITDKDENKKKPFVSDKYQPSAIALDPSLTLTVPKASTAFTAIDALSHAVEAYTSGFGFAFPEDREYAPSAVKRIFASLRTALEAPQNLKARRELQLASFEAGMAFRRIGTGYIHAIAHRLGEYCHIPHGMAIALVFTKVMKESLPFMKKALYFLAVYCEMCSGDNEEENALAFINETERLIRDTCGELKIEIAEEDIADIVLRSQEEAKLTGCPRPFSDDEVRAIIESII